MSSRKLRWIAVAVLAAVAIAVSIRSRDGAAPEDGAPSASGTSVPSSLVPNAQVTYATIEGQMRACFAAQQMRHATPRGRAVFAVNLAGDGQIVDVGPDGETTYDEACVACMKKAIRSLRFDAPRDHEPVTIRIPVNLRPPGVEGPTDAAPQHSGL